MKSQPLGLVTRRLVIALVSVGCVAACVASASANPGVYNFATPTKNIFCAASDPSAESGYLVCYVLSTASGALGYPRSWYLPVHGNASVSRLDNSSDWHDAYRHIVPYRASWHRGYFVCDSRAAGLTCRSSFAPRHGFFLSRESQHTF